MTYSFKKIIYGGKQEDFSLYVPDNIKFTEYYRYNDKQQHIMFVEYYSDWLYNYLQKNDYNFYSYVIGNLIIGYIKNVQPVSKIPYITLEDLNKKYKGDLENIFIEVYRYTDSEYKIPTGELSNDNFVTKELIEYAMPKKTHIETYHLKEFTNIPSDNDDPSIKISQISYNDWLTEKEETSILIRNMSPYRLLNGFTLDIKNEIVSNANDKEVIEEFRDRFNKRVYDIIKKL